MILHRLNSAMARNGTIFQYRLRKKLLLKSKSKRGAEGAGCALLGTAEPEEGGDTFG